MPKPFYMFFKHIGSSIFFLCFGNACFTYLAAPALLVWQRWLYADSAKFKFFNSVEENYSQENQLNNPFQEHKRLSMLTNDTQQGQRQMCRPLAVHAKRLITKLISICMYIICMIHAAYLCNMHDIYGWLDTDCSCCSFLDPVRIRLMSLRLFMAFSRLSLKLKVKSRAYLNLNQNQLHTHTHIHVRYISNCVHSLGKVHAKSKRISLPDSLAAGRFAKKEK